ncbi:hypothetical protein IC762_17485 [Bradyrhizobium genosp. L]|uniref:hypothetical protein n=1 Tax=Bradyrhizobium genosp. L TaxID=83637 RepID=UPI0018A3086C|nr:hypothetical protein [Bradyrhizobium genosp. L]QPF81620.1 hypothetical protein IC762_17485 [Bradyrhizobium genosp. L]
MADVTDIKTMSPAEFDRWLSKSELQAKEQAEAADDAFVAALKKATARGREKATFGTFVDTTPLPFAKRFRPEPRVSISGSPAAMCASSTGDPLGARVLQR